MKLFGVRTGIAVSFYGYNCAIVPYMEMHDCITLFSLMCFKAFISNKMSIQSILFSFVSDVIVVSQSTQKYCSHLIQKNIKFSSKQDYYWLLSMKKGFKINSFINFFFIYLHINGWQWYIDILIHQCAVCTRFTVAHFICASPFAMIDTWKYQWNEKLYSIRNCVLYLKFKM